MFEVKKLIFMETGSYQDQIARPYSMDVRDTQVIHDLNAQTDQGNDLSTSALSGIAGSIIAPSTEAKRDILITNGWGERRYRFMLEIETTMLGQMVKKVIIGYTDHVGVAGIQGHLDQNMKLFINDIIVLRQVGMNWQAFESSHLLIDDIRVHGQGQSIYNSTVMMRPEDVMSTIGAQHSFGNEQYSDFRSSMSLGAQKSNRFNTNHNTYLSKTLKALNSSFHDADYESKDYGDIINQARGKVREPLVHTDHVLSSWDDQSGLFEYGFITYGMLCELSPSTPYVVQHFELAAPVKQATDYTGFTNHFRGSNLADVAVSILNNTVPPLLMDCLLTKISFSATNATMNGQVQVMVDGIPQSFIEGMDIRTLVNNFINRVEYSIMPDVTKHGTLIVNLAMAVDILGETKIEISINGESAEPYVIPSFADALYAPVIGDNTDDLQNLATDISYLAESMGNLNDLIEPISKPMAAPGGGFNNGSNGTNGDW